MNWGISSSSQLRFSYPSGPLNEWQRTFHERLRMLHRLYKNLETNLNFDIAKALFLQNLLREISSQQLNIDSFESKIGG